MTTSDLRHLLGEAAQDIPAAVQSAPLASIHHRIRRRRTNHAVGAMAAVVLVASSLIPLLGNETPDETAARVPLSWSVAELDESGHDLTILIGVSAVPCTPTDPISASVSETFSEVTITLKRTPLDDIGCSAVKVALDSPLRGRALVDGSTNEHRLYFRRSDLPALPNNGHWTTVAPGQWRAPFASQPGWTWDLRGAAYDGFNGFPMGEYEPLGSVTGTISPTGLDTFKYSWLMRKTEVAAWVVYELTLTPPTGQTITSNQFKESLQRLNWADSFID